MKEIFRYGVILFLICAAASGLLALVNSKASPQIILQAREEEENSLKEAMPEAGYFEPVREGEDILYYKAYDQDKNLLGAVFKAKAKGYSSQIETMAGLTNDGCITAIKILGHNETPGLGSKIAEVKEDITFFDAVKGKKSTAAKKPWFEERFSNKKIEELKDIQAITGATISSKAVIESVKKKAEEIKKLLKNENEKR